jgi:cobalt-zinc-cadmium resistance protein CzcA
MLNRIVTFAMNQPLMVFLLVGLFTAAGIAAFKALPVEAFPDVTDTQVQVITLYNGQAAEEVEKKVTVPIEIGLSGIPHSVRLFSHTMFGLSFVVLTFDDGVDAYFARQQTLERLREVQLPDGATPELGPLATPIGEIYRYRLKGETQSPMDLRTLQDWVVEKQIKTVPGVADVVTYGGLVKQYQVQPDLAKLKSYNLSLQQLFSALGKGNANAGGSYLEQGEQQYLIRGIGLLRSHEDIGDIVVDARGGTPILVKDIARVEIGSLPRQGIVGQGKEDDCVNGIVLMRKGENPSEVLKGVREKVDALNGRVLPRGVKIDPIYDRTWLIGTTLKTVFKNLTEGAILVTFVLLLFLGNIRAALIVALTIPLSLLATFSGLTLRGIPANLLSLGAMDFGIIVDGAVIVVENIFRKLSELSHQRGKRRPDLAEIKHVILEATGEVGRPTFFSMLIIITAHIPIFTLQRHEGRIFAPMAWTVVSALIGSLIFSLTLVPLLCYFLLRKKLSERENFVVRACKRVYRPTLEWALGHRTIVLSAAVVMLAASIAITPYLGSEFLPELNEGTMWVNITFPPGVSNGEIVRLTRQVREILGRYPEVKMVNSKAGRPEDGTDPKLINMCEFFVDLRPPSEWRPGLSREDLEKQMDAALDVIPGINPSFSQPIRDNVLESISQIDGQIVVKIFGENGDTLREKAQQALDTIQPIQGVARAFVDRYGLVPQLQIEIDREKAARYGLNVADIDDLIETAIGGRVATEIWEGEKKFDVVVRLNEGERRIDEIKNIMVDAPGGQRIPLRELAAISTRSGQMNISRELGLRVIAIGVFIRDRDMGSLVAEMQQKVGKAVQLPSGYFITWGGEFENQQRAMRRLAMIVPISVLLIFALLFNAFKSVKSAALILFNVPFAVIGGLFALLFTGIHLSVSAAIGFIALFGQSVLNGVVMVSYFNQLRGEGATPYLAVLRGSLTRLRTVLMTALLAMLGLLPMALSHSIGSETQKPLAVVIIGGLISSTILTLIVLPTLYLVFEGRSKGDAAKRTESEPLGEQLPAALGSAAR